MYMVFRTQGSLYNVLSACCLNLKPECMARKHEGTMILHNMDLGCEMEQSHRGTVIGIATSTTATAIQWSNWRWLFRCRFCLSLSFSRNDRANHCGSYICKMIVLNLSWLAWRGGYAYTICMTLRFKQTQLHNYTHLYSKVAYKRASAWHLQNVADQHGIGQDVCQDALMLGWNGRTRLNRRSNNLP